MSVARATNFKLNSFKTFKGLMLHSYSRTKSYGSLTLVHQTARVISC